MAKKTPEERAKDVTRAAQDATPIGSIEAARREIDKAIAAERKKAEENG